MALVDAYSLFLASGRVIISHHGLHIFVRFNRLDHSDSSRILDLHILARVFTLIRNTYRFMLLAIIKCLLVPKMVYIRFIQQILVQIYFRECFLFALEVLNLTSVLVRLNFIRISVILLNLPARAFVPITLLHTQFHEFFLLQMLLLNI